MTDLEEPIYPERSIEGPSGPRGGGAIQQAAEISAVAAPSVVPIDRPVTEHLLERSDEQSLQ
jgi:hypothetical protein